MHLKASNAAINTAQLIIRKGPNQHQEVEADQDTETFNIR